MQYETNSTVIGTLASMVLKHTITVCGKIICHRDGSIPADIDNSIGYSGILNMIEREDGSGLSYNFTFSDGTVVYRRFS